MLTLAIQTPHPLGLSFFRDPLIPNEVYSTCEQQLSRVTIPAIAGRPNGDNIECWNLKGQALAAEYAAVPAEIKNKLTRNTIAICLERPLILNPDEYPLTRILLDGQASVLSEGYVSIWTIVDTENRPTVDVEFDVFTRQNVATVGMKKGQKATIDQHHFEVTNVAESNKEIDSIRVKADKPKALCTYSVTIKFDRDLFLLDHPKATIDTVMTTVSVVTNQSDEDAEFQLIGEYPSRYWSGISIIRTATLHAWMGQIPTRLIRK